MHEAGNREWAFRPSGLGKQRFSDHRGSVPRAWPSPAVAFLERATACAQVQMRIGVWWQILPGLLSLMRPRP